MGQPDLDEEAVFNAARELSAPHAVQAYLDSACAGRPELRRRIERLLDLTLQAGHFFQALPLIQAVQSSEAQATVLVQPTNHDQGSLPRFGDYQLLEEIARGGMGVVYKARQFSLDRLVAVKMLLLGPLAGKDFVQRFRVEASAAASLRHPNIVAVHEVGVHGNQHYLVMDYIAGQTLAKVSGGTPLPPRRAAAYVKTIAEAVHFAHERGVLHRDLKPSNVLIDQDDRPHVTDFGLAKRLDTDSELTLSGQVLGSPNYMSPEQASGKRGQVSRSSDVYSIGAILFHLLTGRPPFLAESVNDTIQLVLEREPVMPRVLVMGIPRDLETICLKGLQKEPKKRFATAQELADELGRFLNDEPIQARRVTQIEKVWRWCWRHGAMAGLGAATAVLLLAIVVGSPIVVYRIDQARQAEVSTRQRADQNAKAAAESAARAEQERNRAERGEQQAKANELAALQNLYSADMLLAARAQEEENLELGLYYLHRHRSKVAQPDLRGWEWRYLWSRMQGDELGTFATNTAAVYSLAISPSGDLLSAAECGSTTNSVKIWEYPSGRLFCAPEANDAAGSVAFSPDGRLVAFGTLHSGLKVWDVRTRREAMSFPGQFATGSGLQFSADGRILATSGAVEIFLFNLEKRALSRALGRHPIRNPCPLAISPDGKTLAARDEGNSIAIWSLPDGVPIARVTNHTAQVVSLLFSPDGKTLVSGGWDATIRLWDLATRRQTAVLTNHTRMVYALAMSPEGRTLASAAADFSVRFWDMASLKQIACLWGSRDELNAAVFTPDGRTLLSAAKDGTIKRWNPGPVSRPAAIMSLPKDAVAPWLDQSTLFCVRSNWFALDLWDPSSLTQFAGYELPAEFRTDPYATDWAVSLDGKLAWATRPNGLMLWELRTQRKIGYLASPTPDDKYRGLSGPDKFYLKARHTGSDLNQLRFSPGGKLLVWTSSETRLSVWSTETLHLVADLPKTKARVYRMAFSASGRLIAAGNDDGSIEVWDLNRQERVAYRAAHRGWIGGIAFLSHDTQLATVSADATAKLWDLPRLTEAKVFPRALNAYFHMAVSPDGERIAASTPDKRVKIWSTITGHELATLKIETLDSSWGMEFLAPDGNILVSLSERNVQLWRAPSLAEIDAAESRSGVPVLPPK